LTYRTLTKQGSTSSRSRLPGGTCPVPSCPTGPARQAGPTDVTQERFMADVQAFRGYRYDLARVGALSEVIAPPYDVIDAALQDALYARNPYNVIRLILNKQTPADTETSSRYTRAGQTLRDWQSEGILTQDSARSLYVYH